MDPDSHLPETYIYEHHLRVAVSMIDGATGRPESLTTQVVCKVAFSWAAKAALSKEAKFYGHPTVVPFYGRETPRYFGLFRTPESARPREPVDEARYKRFVRRFADDCVIDANVLCMVMEHGGSPLPAQIGDEDANLNSLHDQNLHFQIAVVDAYSSLHRAGHCKEAEEGPKMQISTRRNILKRSDGRPCLIDFSRARGAGDHLDCGLRDLKWFSSRLIAAPIFSCIEMNMLLAATDVFERTEVSIPEIDCQFNYYGDSAKDTFNELFKDTDCQARFRKTPEEILEFIDKKVEQHEEYLAERDERLQKEGVVKDEYDARFPGVAGIFGREN
ncbi:hypothetical protein FOMPIDRAFT_93662 [Fomitopsis schrenkii]|uniref:Uncharacterized protein n=1 Tax=Fomitopsis schrenkii TaxID=2126942 RepID=S8FVI4_FOMSC|nr:hypothetical protein FOMPIDRAFT_93662 [Fomitopsis schrenkii]